MIPCRPVVAPLTEPASLEANHHGTRRGPLHTATGAPARIGFPRAAVRERERERRESAASTQERGPASGAERPAPDHADATIHERVRSSGLPALSLQNRIQRIRLTQEGEAHLSIQS